ncbi:unnamed protein product [Cylicocyclus nassatus]|uniref:Uncharacterized protein n=1 Tax=Cylicocyclus nassatus TaxID=53992 RepID=A0AA36GR89_CYLNA|nr:unnamed protein product [Cylicocyclus nassatus]
MDYYALLMNAAQISDVSMALVTQLLCVFLLVNVVSCHYLWFDMPSPQKLSDGAESLYEDEPLQQMQKRFRVKYIRELGRLPEDHHLQPLRLWASPTSPQDHLINLYNILRRVVK